MNNKIIWSFLFILLSQISFSQKQLHNDSRAFVETETGGLIIFNHFNQLDLNFYLNIKNHKVKPTERNNIYVIDDSILQILVVDKNSIPGKNDVEKLINYAQNETAYNAKYLKTQLKPVIEKIDINSVYPIRFWYYDLPESISKEVKNQMYLILVYKNYIIGLNTAQFSHQKFDDVKQFLIEMYKSIRFSNQRITLEYLCKAF